MICSDKQPIRVTIVTPVYNQASTIGETIDSVLGQTYAHIEYIVVNDGSTDNTADILARYEDRVRIITQKNLGQSSALNNAWSLASGEYLTYLSADDILYPHCIETLVEHIDDESLVYYPDYDLIDSQSRIIRSLNMPDYKDSDLICNLICQPGLASLFKADVLRKIGGWDSSYRFIPDFEFWTRVLLLGNFKRVPVVVGGFRVHDESGSVKAVSKTASNEIIRFVEEYQAFPDTPCKQAALFQALLMASRSHLQSYRLLTALGLYLNALKLNSVRALTPTSFRFVVSGLFRKLYYRYRSFFG